MFVVSVVNCGWCGCGCLPCEFLLGWLFDFWLLLIITLDVLVLIWCLLLCCFFVGSGWLVDCLGLLMGCLCCDFVALGDCSWFGVVVCFVKRLLASLCVALCCCLWLVLGIMFGCFCGGFLGVGFCI